MLTKAESISILRGMGHDVDETTSDDRLRQLIAAGERAGRVVAKEEITREAAFDIAAGLSEIFPEGVDEVPCAVASIGGNAAILERLQAAGYVRLDELKGVWWCTRDPRGGFTKVPVRDPQPRSPFGA